ncbi:MAG TPA: quinolinate synthase NadA [Candidatus Hydrogenedentes bacterium]|nr:quinolinate synthase NadA [Candidatus Hydrogenedentota bacterium]
MSATATLPQAASLEETRRFMHEILKGIVPDVEIETKVELAYAINKRKREMNAVILGHNYMEPALYHSVTDYVGDSLQLSSIAAKTDADIIVFCGVWFMGETAKVLNPAKTVLVPSMQAGCSLAEGISGEDIRQLKMRFPGAVVVTYVNTYAAAKAESDYCCTSGNADKVLGKLIEQGCKRILFLPDAYLAANTAVQMGIPFLDSESDDPAFAAVPDDQPLVIGWHAKCEVHELFTPEDVDNIRRQYPDAVILAHPECPPEVIAKVDVSGSTKTMVDYVRDVDAPQYALLTECAMGDNLAAEFPHRRMVRACTLRCKHMNYITLEETLAGLEKLQYKVELEPELIERARKPIERMIAIR